MNTVRAPSLHRRLAASVTVLSLLLGILGAFGAWMVVRQLGAQFNRDLEAAASAMNKPAGPDTAKQAPTSFPHILIQTWTLDGVSPQHTNDRSLVLPRSPQGFSTVQGVGGDWDVFALQAGSEYVQIAEQRAVRNANAWRVAIWTLAPAVLFLPLLVWLIRSTVRISMRPLEAIAQHVLSMDLNRLERLDTDRTPEEVRPFLDSLNRMIMRLNTLVQSERTFITNAAHELRSPITALQLQLGNLRQASPENFAERLADLERGVTRTSNLLTQLLDLARAEATSSRPPVKIPVSEVVQDVVTDLLPFAIQRGADLGVERNENAHVSGQEADLRVLLKNLIDNAIRYGGEGCRIDVTVSRSGQNVEIEVADDGPGIPYVERARVFERFYRGGNMQESGSGLGLSIVQTVAANLNGSIFLRSRSDGHSGLVIGVSLPTLPDAPA